MVISHILQIVIPLHTLTFSGSKGDLPCNCCHFVLHQASCPHEFASSSVANTKRVSFSRGKVALFQVSEAHYCRLLTTLPLLSWPVYYLLLTIIRVCMENITCAKNVPNWCKIELSFELT